MPVVILLEIDPDRLRTRHKLPDRTAADRLPGVERLVEAGNRPQQRPLSVRFVHLLSIERDRTDRAFDDVVVEFDAATIDEERQTFPS